MRAEVKKWAKENRDGNKWNVWQVLLISGLISGCASSLITIFFGNPNSPDASPIASLLDSAVTIALLPMSIGMILYIVNIVKKKKFELSQLFSKYNQFLRIFVTGLIEGLLIFVFTLLLIVPGIIRAISYFLVNYILADSDFDDLSSGEILDLSRKLMDGHKSDYFMMSLYYFGMLLLGCFTLGILWIWTIPEMNLAYAKFATNLLEDYKKSNKSEKTE
jgi:uncharacterized membrane protein